MKQEEFEILKGHVEEKLEKHCRTTDGYDFALKIVITLITSNVGFEYGKERSYTERQLLELFELAKKYEKGS